ncbi:MAG: YdcF family protein [Gemmatimonadaceae bacterium]
MDLLLRGRGRDITAQAPRWLIRLSGGMLAFGLFALADRLGLSDVTGASPLLLRLGALLLGALIAPTVYGALLWIVGGLLVTLTMLVAFTPIVRPVAMSFVRQDSNNEAVDAVVVLSGSMNDAGRLSGQVLDRLISGIAEARRRNITTIALSVIDEGKNENRITSESDQRRLMALLAPDLTVRYVSNVRSTRDEALLFAALARTYQWNRVALVTSPMHSRRACRTLEVAGLKVSCVVAESRDYALTPLRAANSRMNAFRDVVYETLATTLYRFRGWN